MDLERHRRLLFKILLQKEGFRIAIGIIRTQIITYNDQASQIKSKHAE